MKKFIVWSGKPIKNLTFSLRSTSGRTVEGFISCWHRGGGHKKRYRFLDFFYKFRNVYGIVRRLEYDPCRNAFIILVCYFNGILVYHLAFEGVKVGDFFGFIGFKELGCRRQLKNFFIGSLLYNVELFKGGSIARSAGTNVQIIRHFFKYSLLRLASGEYKLVCTSCEGNLGRVSNSLSYLLIKFKAGTSRWLGNRPIVRGVAQNPVDHPHGGGEGKSQSTRCSISPWGNIVKGKKTVKRYYV